MIIQPDFLEHWKTETLVALTGQEIAPLCLIRFWAYCQKRKSGVFRKDELTDEVLSRICKWKLEPAVFFKAMLRSRFIDETDDNFEAHEWEKHNSSLIRAWENGCFGGRPKKGLNKGDRKPRDNPEITHGKPRDNPRVLDLDLDLDKKKKESESGTAYQVSVSPGSNNPTDSDSFLRTDSKKKIEPERSKTMTRKREDRLRRDIDDEVDGGTDGDVSGDPGAEIKEFLLIYPAKQGEPDDTWTRKEFGEAIRTGVNPQDLIKAAKNYRKECDKTNKTGTQYIRTAVYWIRDGDWRDWLGGMVEDPVLKTEKYLSVCREFGEKLAEKDIFQRKLLAGDITEEDFRKETKKLDFILAKLANSKREILEHREEVK